MYMATVSVCVCVCVCVCVVSVCLSVIVSVCLSVLLTEYNFSHFLKRRLTNVLFNSQPGIQK